MLLTALSQEGGTSQIKVNPKRSATTIISHPLYYCLKKLNVLPTTPFYSAARRSATCCTGSACRRTCRTSSSSSRSAPSPSPARTTSSSRAAAPAGQSTPPGQTQTRSPSYQTSRLRTVCGMSRCVCGVSRPVVHFRVSEQQKAESKWT